MHIYVTDGQSLGDYVGAILVQYDGVSILTCSNGNLTLTAENPYSKKYFLFKIPDAGVWNLKVIKSSGEAKNAQIEVRNGEVKGVKITFNIDLIGTYSWKNNASASAGNNGYITFNPTYTGSKQGNQLYLYSYYYGDYAWGVGSIATTQAIDLTDYEILSYSAYATRTGHDAYTYHIGIRSSPSGSYSKGGVKNWYDTFDESGSIDITNFTGKFYICATIDITASLPMYSTEGYMYITSLKLDYK